jgi:tetratricopeptide (TPR) repeat protein
MRYLWTGTSLAILSALGLAGISGCEGDEIAANQRMVKEQQAQIEEMQREIETLKAGQPTGYRPGVASPAGGCDHGIEETATKRGGERFAASDFAKALGYYQDALTACPGDPQAELNVARAYEALGDGTRAIAHYRAATKPVDGAIGPAQQQAEAALRRLQVSDLP